MKDFRDIIYLIEQMEQEALIPVESTPEIIEETCDVSGRLEDLIFKMRAHSEPLCESQEGGYALGVETGLEMAAEMLENLLREMGGQY